MNSDRTALLKEEYYNDGTMSILKSLGKKTKKRFFSKEQVPLIQFLKTQKEKTLNELFEIKI